VLPGCTPVSPANEQWFDPSVKCTPYDPADAKKLVASSGISDPTVRLLVANQTETLRLAQFIQAQEAAVGINVVIEATDTATAAARSVAGNYDAFLSSWSGGADPDTNIYLHFTTNGVRNLSGYSSPRLDFVLGNGRKALTERARKTLYRVAQQILIEDRPVIVLFTPIRYAGLASNVTGVKLFQNIILRVEYAQLT
jgi:peptide/nickel transport system substrate-binding protein